MDGIIFFKYKLKGIYLKWLIIFFAVLSVGMEIMKKQENIQGTELVLI